MSLKPYSLKTILCTLIAVLMIADPGPATGQEFPAAPNQVKLRVPHAMAVGIRKNAKVYMLGEAAGTIANLDYAADGRSVEFELDLKPEFASKVVRSSRAVISSDDQGTSLEIIRTTDLLGLSAEPVTGGLMVASVFANGPAALAGVQAGDRLISINGKPTKSMAALATAYAGITDGDSVKIKVTRSNKPETLKATASRDAGLAMLTGNEMLQLVKLRTAAPGGGSTGNGAAMNDTMTEASEFLTHIGADADILMTNLKDLTENASDMMEKLQGEMEYVPGTMMEVREMMKNAGDMVEKFQGATSGIDGMMSQASNTMCQVNEMVSGVRNTRIMKTIVNRNQKPSGGRRFARRR